MKRLFRQRVSAVLQVILAWFYYRAIVFLTRLEKKPLIRWAHNPRLEDYDAALASTVQHNIIARLHQAIVRKNPVYRKRYVGVTIGAMQTSEGVKRWMVWMPGSVTEKEVRAFFHMPPKEE